MYKKTEQYLQHGINNLPKKKDVTLTYTTPNFLLVNFSVGADQSLFYDY